MFHELVTTGPDTDGNLHDTSTLTASLSVSQCFPRCLALRRSLSLPFLLTIALLAPRLFHSCVFHSSSPLQICPFAPLPLFSPATSALDACQCLAPLFSLNKPALSLPLLLHLLRCPLLCCLSLRCPDCTAPSLVVSQRAAPFLAISHRAVRIALLSPSLSQCTAPPPRCLIALPPPSRECAVNVLVALPSLHCTFPRCHIALPQPLAVIIVCSHYTALVPLSMLCFLSSAERLLARVVHSLTSQLSLQEKAALRN